MWLLGQRQRIHHRPRGGSVLILLTVIMVTMMRWRVAAAWLQQQLPQQPSSSFQYSRAERVWKASRCGAQLRAASTTTTTISEDDSAATTAAAIAAAQLENTQKIMVNGRWSGAGLSLDVKTIASNNLDVVKSHLTSRRAGPEAIQAVEAIARSAELRVQLIRQRDAALNRRRELSAKVGKLMAIQRKNGDNAKLNETQQKELDLTVAASNEAATEADAAETQLADIQQEMDRQLAGLPNLLDDRVPDGKDDSENEQVRVWGDVTALPTKLGWTPDFTPAWHDDVAAALDGYKAEAAVQMSGARFVALQGDVARLERALAMFFVDLHSQTHGYTEVSVPYVVSRSALEGTGQLPKFEQDLFAIKPESHTCNGEDAFLIPTAEVPVTNLHRDQVLEEDDLPLSYVSWTPCFRAEAGSYGRDTKGLIRTHQFQKVELVKITTADASDAQHEELTGHAEACLQALELPYRKVRLCSGDIGFGARHCYDLEVWLPGASEYREISSCSNMGDFQARRMSLRYRPKVEGGAGKKKVKPLLCHTINGSGLAVGRTLVAVLENYQKPDGSVVVPDVLRPYMGGKEILKPPLFLRK